MLNLIYKSRENFIIMNVIEYSVKKDKRFFSKLLSKKNKKMLKKNIQEINLSFNKKKGTIRGLHFQIGKYKKQK